MRVSTVTWYICAFGSCTRIQVRPRVVEIETPGSLAIAIRDGFVGSIHMSWLSPPGFAIGKVTVSARGGPPGAAGRACAAAAACAPPPAPDTVWPPSNERLNVAQRKYVSSGLSGATARRV